MKKILVLLSLVPFFTWAHGNKIEMVEAATSTALQKFSTDEPKAVVDSFNAIKSWVSGNQIKVKVYYNSNANTVDYSCSMMDHSNGSEEMMMCSK